MRDMDNSRWIENPYIRVVWIAALCSELKVTNPDNAADAVSSRFFRICNQKDLNISICNAEKYHINADYK